MKHAPLQHPQVPPPRIWARGGNLIHRWEIIGRSRVSRKRGGEKKNINIPDFSPVDFAFSPRRWWAIYRVAGGYLLFPVFVSRRFEGWALRRGVARRGPPTAYAYFNWNSRTPTTSPGRPVGETTPPEDIVSNEYANHESGPGYVVRCNFYSPTRMDILNAPQI